MRIAVALLLTFSFSSSLLAGTLFEVAGTTGWVLKPEDSTYDAKKRRSYGYGVNLGYNFYSVRPFLLDVFLGHKAIEYNEQLSESQVIHRSGTITESGFRMVLTTGNKYFFHLGIDFGGALLDLEGKYANENSSIFYGYFFGANFKNYMISLKRKFYVLNSSSVLEGAEIAFTVYF